MATIKQRMVEAIALGLEEADLGLDTDQVGETALTIADSVFDEFLVSAEEQFTVGTLVPVEGQREDHEDDWK